MEDGTRVPHPEDLFGPEPIHDASPMAREAQRIAQAKEGIDPFTNEEPVVRNEERAEDFPGIDDEPIHDASPMAREAQLIAQGKLDPNPEPVGKSGEDDVATILRQLVEATKMNTELLQQISESLESGIKMTF